MERTEMELRELQEHFEEIEEREDEEIDYGPAKGPTIETLFLVQRIIDYNSDDEFRTSSLMTLSELVHYIDMQDYCYERYDIWEVTEFGKMIHLHYVGWQPGCLIEFATDDGTVVHSGYGEDH